jgi:hypothetical protein
VSRKMQRRLSQAGEIITVPVGPVVLGPVEETRQVTAVLVLTGMPRVLTLSVLIHEALHVYLKLNSEFSLRLPRMVEEGLCQYVAHRWLVRQPMGEVDCDLFRRQIEEDKSKEYGDGFRLARHCVEKLGFAKVFEFVKKRQCFPSI